MANAIISGCDHVAIEVKGTPPFTVRISFFKGPDGEVIEFMQRIRL